MFTEFIKEGYKAGENIFYLRDQNGVEIDFIIEKDAKIFLVEAKTSERPNPKKLNFNKIAPLLTEEVVSVVACTVEEQGLIALKNFSVYNPLYGFSLK